MIWHVLNDKPCPFGRPLFVKVGGKTLLCQGQYLIPADLANIKSVIAELVDGGWDCYEAPSEEFVKALVAEEIAKL